MANWAQTKLLEDLADAEGGTQTIANFRAYYQAYKKEQAASKPVSYEDYLAVVESYMRNSALPGAA